MAEFKCEVVKIEIEEVPSSDFLELAVVGGGIRCIVRKGQYQSGDHVIYIPEAAIVPDDILEELGLVGKLAGKAKNRVKPIRLRGVLSDGLIMPIREGMSLGDDVTEVLGVTKYIPQIPSSMSGEVEAIAGMTSKYDFSNLYRVPDIFDDADEVVITEKLHGSFCGVSLTHDDEMYVWSKGLGGNKELVFKNSEKNLMKNTYLQTLVPDFVEPLKRFAGMVRPKDSTQVVRVFGEVYGKVQDLTYGVNGKAFRVFDAMLGNEYLDYETLVEFCEVVELPMVPELFRGDFDVEIADSLAYGKTTLDGDHIREGVVIKTMIESRHDKHGRRIAKIVSDDYKGRKGGTELN